MSIGLGVIILVGGFIALFKLFRLTETARKTFSAAHDALAVMQAPGKDDEQKEAEMQALAKKLFGCFLLLTIGSCGALGIPAGAVWGLDHMGVLSFQAVVDFTISWEFLLGTTGVLVLIGLFKGRRKGNGFEIRYSRGERALHQIAFATPLAQLSVADMEDGLFKKRIKAARNDHPVFITGLPRGGTTLLLNLLYALDEFASHRYRDMPFLLTPLLWDKFSRLFQQSDEMRERAHGDGMMVGVDSPEALEEMVWKPFWSKQYGNESIIPWPATSNEAFDEFFDIHMAKIIALAGNESTEHRYVSKNNLNIARIDYLRSTHPNATIVIPFRHPVPHARSLLKQHLNFLEIHEQDSFARAYMEGVGHYDFGKNLRPVDFGGWLEDQRFPDPTDINFWLEYWIAAYSHIITTVGDRVHLHSHEALCDNPEAVLSKLADLLIISDKQALLQEADTVWRGSQKEFPTDGFDPHLLKKGDELWKRLRKASYAA